MDYHWQEIGVGLLGLGVVAGLVFGDAFTLGGVVDNGDSTLTGLGEPKHWV